MKDYEYKMVINELLFNYDKVVDNVKVIPNYRTDGGGRIENEKRLVCFSNLVHMTSSIVFENIKLLHDHKGILTVYCKRMNIETKELCRVCWEFFNENEIEFESEF